MVKIVGVEEVTLHYEEAVAYLKVDNQKLDRDGLQYLISSYTSI
jgi:hypothetical protein